ncbi:MAG TPA: hypothetical protein P5149_14575 [Candidatus Competibacteraceae bacterium]|nr:hypothetical protein [Candidatus Competibacteraceae bacterium]MCP5134424.1 hypothetical protein [Gammaproteobacteria bacterium]HPF60137.1 hypothetical protein [Candidatus Competibacteraceae bacterium]HRY19614.1 hypothetical protein [Candidatus Competibacteraceae bacterium]
MVLTNPWNITLRNLIVQPRYWLVIAAGLSGLAMAPAWANPAWTAVIRPDPVTRQSRCLLVSETLITPDGYDSTPVFLALDGMSLRIVTESELDVSFNDLRLDVDIEPPVYSNKLIQKTILVFDHDIPKLIEQFRKGKQTTVHLRFWPTWPATQSFPVQFNLIGFSKAHDSFTHGCQPTG